MGSLLREYWIPAALSSELASDGDPVRLLLLGERLIAFRDSSGKVGIMDHRCPHRCASLFFGRNEQGGIRCVYHGWKFDVEGNCLDMANVPPHQDYKHKVRAKAYATRERNGLIWVFMGDQSKVPELPWIEANMMPEHQVDLVFRQRDCNWLQVIEGCIDTSHADFLHGGERRPEDFEDDDPLRWGAVHRAPEYKLIETEVGLMYGAYRPGNAGETYWRIAHFAMPFWAHVPSRPFENHVVAGARVPMDDTHTMTIFMRAKEGQPLQHPNHLPNTTDWYGRFRPTASAANDYNINRTAQRTSSYTGIASANFQDQAVEESMGKIVDRTLEHLAPSDIAVTHARRLLLTAARTLAKSGTPPLGSKTPQAYFNLRSGFFMAPEGQDWLEAYQERLDRERTGAPARGIGGQAT